MSFEVRLTLDAIENLAKHKKSGDKIRLRKIETLLEELRLDPKIGTGHPKKLKYDLEDF